MHQRQYPQNEPFFLQWHITNNCNLQCLHCYRPSEASLPTELSYDKLQKILHQFSDFLKQIGRMGRIQFTGGEPFLSPHLFPLIKEARRLKISSRILSNGTTITKETVSQLKESGCCLVQISLEGEQTVNNRIRGEGTFEKAISGMRLLRNNGIEVTVNMTLCRENANELEPVAKIAAQNANRFCVSRFVPINRDQRFSKQQMLSSREYYHCLKKLLKLKKKYPTIEIPLRDPLWHQFFRVPSCRSSSCVHGCSVGYNGLTLDYEGTIYPCRRLPVILGNIIDHDFEEIWRESPVLNQLRDRDLLKGKCRRCNRRWLCGGCRGIAYAQYGDYLAEDPQCFRNQILF